MLQLVIPSKHKCRVSYPSAFGLIAYKCGVDTLHSARSYVVETLVLLVHDQITRPPFTMSGQVSPADTCQSILWTTRVLNR